MAQGESDDEAVKVEYTTDSNAFATGNTGMGTGRATQRASGWRALACPGVGGLLVSWRRPRFSRGQTEIIQRPPPRDQRATY